MKFRRYITPAVLIVTLLVQFLPGTTFAPRPVAAAACDAAEFVADVTIPDGTSYAPGAALMKTWRFKNIGTCTWSTTYAIVFYSGTKMGAPSAVNLPTSVAPGATVDVTVNMTAPTTPGHYRGYWMLRNASSVLFGVGPYGTYWFFIDIIVSGSSSSTAYDFVANYCSATWTSGAGALPCPGTDGDVRGFVLKLNAPKLETGSTGPAGLLTFPQNITDGYIQGVYPAFTVQSGDHFMSIINCQYGATGCYVTFQLNYQIGSGSVYTLKTFREKIEGMYYNLDVNLSALAGQNVKFILKVLAYGSPSGDRAIWAGARIARLGGPTPPPVSTCDKAAFVADVTIPDGTALAGGTPFTKTWRLQNVGTCTWTTSYRLVFAGGDYMGASASGFNLPTSVAPGGSIDLSVNLTAPISAGNFIGYWKLRNASGTNFGVGASGTSAFLVNINVISSYGSAYDFVTNANSAIWSSGAGALPWPGTDGDARGFVLPRGSHQMEDGISSPEGLLTFPQYVTDGYIQGIYPGFTVQSGDHFQSYIGCQYGGPSNCYIVFRLAYQIGSGPVYTLKTAAERLEGLVYRMDVDLSALAGSNVKFILKVEAFGSPSGDRAVWSAPRIVRSGSVPPGPTATPGPSPTATPIVPTPTGVIVGPSADLSVTINDSVGTYTPGSTTGIYTVVVNNGGPSAVTGLGTVVTIYKPWQITTWTVNCAASAGAACTAGPVTTVGNITDSVNIPVGGNVTYTIHYTISASAVDNMVTTATVTNPGAIPDPNLANNSATDTDAPPSADLAITINDGITLWTPGGSTTYTVVVTNGGPLNVTGAVFNDNKPAQVTSWNWICTPQAGATCGAGSGGAIATGINDTVNIPSGKYVTYTIVATLGTVIPGNLVNTVTITAPIGTPDPILANNSATDTDTGPSADLYVTKTDGVAFYTPSGTLTYTIRVANNGPQTVVGANFADNKPAQISAWSWTCVPDFSSSCAAGPTVPAGAFSETINLAAGQGVTYTVVATVAAVPVGNLVNTASVTAPGAIPDSNLANNTATDTDSAPTADISVGISDGITTYPVGVGATVTYTVVVSNLGPAPATGVTVASAMPANLTSWIWTCVASGTATCTAVPIIAAPFSDTVSIPAGGHITYTMVGTIVPAPAGDLVTTVTIASPVVTDPILGNNVASDTDIHPTADLEVLISDGVATYVAGGSVIYQITVNNLGPSDITTPAAFSDAMPANLNSWSWTCAPQIGASCVTGTINQVFPATFTDSVIIPAGKHVTYTVTTAISGGASGNLINTASITAPALYPDPNAVNDSATDIDTP